MLNPEATRDVAARPAPSGGERELKFTMPAARVQLARRRLETLCRRDPEFPSAIVWTIYYDTPALVSLGEKINSDYLKRKIRVRWYSDLEGRVTGRRLSKRSCASEPAGRKCARDCRIRPTTIARWDLQDTRLQRLPLLLREQGVLGQDSWQPMMLIRYRRDRFIEPLTRSRVSLDTEIAAAVGEPAVPVGCRPVAVGDRRARGERRPATNFRRRCARFWRSAAVRARSRSSWWSTRT